MEQARQQLEQQLIEKAWGDEQFRAELIANPKKVIERLVGQALPQNIEIKVVEETADTLYLRIPVNPEDLSTEDLDRVAGGVPCDEPGGKCETQTCPIHWQS